MFHHQYWSLHQPPSTHRALQLLSHPFNFRRQRPPALGTKIYASPGLSELNGTHDCLLRYRSAEIPGGSLRLRSFPRNVRSGISLLGLTQHRASSVVSSSGFTRHSHSQNVLGGLQTGRQRADVGWAADHHLGTEVDFLRWPRPPS